jgi:hypothetical protein
MSGFELKDAFTGIGLVVAVCGWEYSRWKDRRHELFKERLKRRLDMHDSAFEAFLPFTNAKDGRPEVDADKLEKARTKIQLYGHEDEIAAYERFVSRLNAGDVDGVNSSLGQLIPLMVAKLRNELGYK